MTPTVPVANPEQERCKIFFLSAALLAFFYYNRFGE
jgi:hypothetical protein